MDDIPVSGDGPDRSSYGDTMNGKDWTFLIGFVFGLVIGVWLMILVAELHAAVPPSVAQLIAPKQLTLEQRLTRVEAWVDYHTGRPVSMWIKQ